MKLFGAGKPAHPMADGAQARAVVRDLPLHNPRRCSAEVVRWLALLVRSDDVKPAQLCENIGLLDAAAREPVRRLMLDFLGSGSAPALREHDLWTAAYEVWSHLADAYLYSAQRCVADRGKAAMNLLPVQVARGIRALRKQITWTLMRYDPPDASIWGKLFRLYRIAETQGFAETRIEMYRDAYGSGSARQEFAKALMMVASSTESLPDSQQELAQRVIAHFSIEFRIADLPLAGCNYSIDLATSRPPFRFSGHSSGGSSQRFCGVAPALRQLEQLMATVADTGAVPWYVNLGGEYPPEAVLGVLAHLRTRWTVETPRRAVERRPTAASIAVVPGFAGIVEVVVSVPATQRIPVPEMWVVENRNETGYGAIVPEGKGAWASVDLLVGVRMEGLRHWAVGIVRRLSRDEHGQRRAGIQLLTPAAIPVRLVRRPDSVVPAESNAPAEAILLSTSLDARGEVGMLLGRGVFAIGDRLEMQVNDQVFPLALASLVERGEDYEWASCRVMNRAG